MRLKRCLLEAVLRLREFSFPSRFILSQLTSVDLVHIIVGSTSCEIRVYSSGSSEPNNVMSVAVDPPVTASRQPAWALAGITQAENAFWHRHKNVAEMVIKANK